MSDLSSDLPAVMGRRSGAGCERYVFARVRCAVRKSCIRLRSDRDLLSTFQHPWLTYPESLDNDGELLGDGRLDATAIPATLDICTERVARKGCGELSLASRDIPVGDLWGQVRVKAEETVECDEQQRLIAAEAVILNEATSGRVDLARAPGEEALDVAEPGAARNLCVVQPVVVCLKYGWQVLIDACHVQQAGQKVRVGIGDGCQSKRVIDGKRLDNDSVSWRSWWDICIIRQPS